MAEPKPNFNENSNEKEQKKNEMLMMSICNDISKNVNDIFTKKHLLDTQFKDKETIEDPSAKKDFEKLSPEGEIGSKLINIHEEIERLKFNIEMLLD